jgi:hypothetical protein
MAMVAAIKLPEDYVGYARQRVTSRCRATAHPHDPTSTRYCWEPKSPPALRAVAPHAKLGEPTATAARLASAMPSGPALEWRDSAAA